VIIVNERMAQMLWPGENAIGNEFSSAPKAVTRSRSSVSPPRVSIGLAEIQAYYYSPMAQRVRAA